MVPVCPDIIQKFCWNRWCAIQFVLYPWFCAAIAHSYFPKTWDNKLQQSSPNIVQSMNPQITHKHCWIKYSFYLIGTKWHSRHKHTSLLSNLHVVNFKHNWSLNHLRCVLGQDTGSIKGNNLAQFGTWTIFQAWFLLTNLAWLAHRVRVRKARRDLLGSLWLKKAHTWFTEPLKCFTENVNFNKSTGRY